MNTVRRLTKNISVLFLSDILSYIFAFFTLTYSARYLGVEGFGTLSLALAFAAVFTFFLDLGTDTFITREIARDYSLAEGYVANMIPLRIITSLVTLGLIFLISHIIHYNQDTIAIIMIIAVYTVFSTFSQLFFDIFSAYEKFEYTSVGFLLFNILL